MAKVGRKRNPYYITPDGQELVGFVECPDGRFRPSGKSSPKWSGPWQLAYHQFQVWQARQTDNGELEPVVNPIKSSGSAESERLRIRDLIATDPKQAALYLDYAPLARLKIKAISAASRNRVHNVGLSSPSEGHRSAIRSGLDKARSAAEKFKTGFDNLVQKGLEANLKNLQRMAARREELALTATEQGVASQLARLEFDLARTTPFGNIGAMREYLDLQKQLNQEIQALTDVMQNIDQSTRQGRIEAMQINQQIKSLRLEEKTRGLEMTRAMLDSVQAQAFNAGKFEKIIFTQDRNVRAGLSMGVITPSYPQIFGSTGHPSGGRHPVRLNPATNAVEATDNLAKAARDLSGYLQDLIGEDESDNPLRPGAAGFATLN